MQAIFTMKKRLQLQFWVLFSFEVWNFALISTFLDLPAIDILEIGRFTGEQLGKLTVESAIWKKE